MKAVCITALFLGLAGFITSSGEAQKSSQSVTIHFAARVGSKPFACGTTYDNIGLSHAQITPRDLRFFLSEVELLTADGRTVPIQLKQDGVWQYKNLALLDFEDGTGACINGNSGINQEIVGTAPAAKYVGLRFTFGVPFELDHISAITAPSPLNTSAMFWSWQDGYKFLRAEVATVNTTTHRPSGFAVHVGSTGCAATDAMSSPSQDCLHPNRATITFVNFNAEHDQIVFDFTALLTNVNLAAPSSGCMSFPGAPACSAPMRAIGLPYDSAPAAEQIVFRREARP